MAYSNLIKASAVKALTGWTDLRNARRAGMVEMVRRRGQIWYRLDSINPVFIKKSINLKIMYKAICYIAPIRQWALTNGIPFFTWPDQRKAISRYELFRAQLN